MLALSAAAMTKTHPVSLLLLASAVATFACNKKSDDAAPGAATAAPTTAAGTSAAKVDPSVEAEKFFKARCVVCHGEGGTGDGAGAAALKVKPRNYTDAEWQKTVTDDQLREIIVKGGAAVGKDSAMPSSADLKAKPEVLDAVIKKIRSFAKG